MDSVAYVQFMMLFTECEAAVAATKGNNVACVRDTHAYTHRIYILCIVADLCICMLWYIHTYRIYIVLMRMVAAVGTHIEIQKTHTEKRAS